MGSASSYGGIWTSMAKARRRRSVPLGPVWCIVRWVWKVAPPARSGIGTTCAGSTSSITSALTIGSSYRWRWVTMPVGVRAGHELHAPVVDVDVVEREPHAAGVVAEVLLPERLVLVPRRLVAVLRRLVDHVRPRLEAVDRHVEQL